MINLNELNESAAFNRITFLAMLDEFDVKGKLSGKQYTSILGQPHDILGYFVQRLGYTIADEKNKCLIEDNLYTNYAICRYTLNIFWTRPIWEEIDRTNSTNQSIKQITKEYFASEPLNIRSPHPLCNPRARLGY